MSKSYNKQWSHKGSIIRQRGSSYQAETNHNGKRVRKSFETKAEAETYAEQVQTEIKNLGASAFSLTAKQRQDAIEALQLLNKNTTLAEAARFWMRHNHPKGGTLTLAELYDKYIQSKRKANRRPETIHELQRKLKHLIVHFEGRAVHTITATELLTWLDDYTYTPLNRNKHKRLFHALFKYAQREGLIEKNPASDIETASEDEVLPEAYPTKQVERIMHAAETVYPDLVPTLAIGFFAGLRPSEIKGLDWQNIDLESHLIRVTPETAKKRRQRYVDISENLAEWLLPYRKQSGLVSVNDYNYRKHRATILKKARAPRWIKNGLRHTYGSMHLAMHKNAPQTANQMGHLGVDLLYNHYRDLVKPKDADSYWKIQPKGKTKVISFEAKAS